MSKSISAAFSVLDVWEVIAHHVVMGGAVGIRDVFVLRRVCWDWATQLCFSPALCRGCVRHLYVPENPDRVCPTCLVMWARDESMRRMRAAPAAAAAVSWQAVLSEQSLIFDREALVRDVLRGAVTWVDVFEFVRAELSLLSTNVGLGLIKFHTRFDRLELVQWLWEFLEAPAASSTFLTSRVMHCACESYGLRVFAWLLDTMSPDTENVSNIRYYMQLCMRAASRIPRYCHRFWPEKRILLRTDDPWLMRGTLEADCVDDAAAASEQQAYSKTLVDLFVRAQQGGRRLEASAELSRYRAAEDRRQSGLSPRIFIGCPHDNPFCVRDVYTAKVVPTYTEIRRRMQKEHASDTSPRQWSVSVGDFHPACQEDADLVQILNLCSLSTNTDANLAPSQWYYICIQHTRSGGLKHVLLPRAFGRQVWTPQPRLSFIDYALFCFFYDALVSLLRRENNVAVAVHDKSSRTMTCVHFILAEVERLRLPVVLLVEFLLWEDDDNVNIDVALLPLLIEYASHVLPRTCWRIAIHEACAHECLRYWLTPKLFDYVLSDWADNCSVFCARPYDYVPAPLAEAYVFAELVSDDFVENDENYDYFHRRYNSNPAALVTSFDGILVYCRMLVRRRRAHRLFPLDSRRGRFVYELSQRCPELLAFLEGGN